MSWREQTRSVSYDGSESSHTFTLEDHSCCGGDIPKAIRLLDQIIEIATEDDNLHKASALKSGNGSQAIGESWTVHHLKALKQLLES